MANYQRVGYLAVECPRLRYLLRIFDAEGLFANTDTDRPRFIIVCHWPVVGWLVEMFLHALGLKYVTIAGGSRMADRSDAVAKFTDRRSACTVLLTTYNCGALGLNLHTHCSRLVLMEPSLNFNAEFQAIGRVHRLGQRKPQKVWRLFQDHTISRWIEWNNQRKILPQLAAQHQDAIAPALGAEMAGEGSSDGPEAEVSAEDADDARSMAIRALAKSVLRNILGMEEGCADRDSLGNIYDIGTETARNGDHVSKRMLINIRPRSGHGKRGPDDEFESPGSKRQQGSR